MRELTRFKGGVVHSPKCLTHGLLHFGGIADAFHNGDIRWPIDKMPCGLTWFHVPENDKRLKMVSHIDQRLAFWHSSCSSTANTLMAHGASPDKVHVIPLGVDNTVFKPAAASDITLRKTQLGIPDDAIVIGSFQKDGTGWKTGEKPKLIKGPDVFCDVIEQLSKNIKIFVLLSGPARGYVIGRLEAMKVPYIHTGYLEHADHVADYYQLLDIYLITSRIEGGPKAALEACACGVPLVTTNVGMIQDIHHHGQTAMITEVDDRSTLTSYVEDVISDKDLRSSLSLHGRNLGLDHSWQKIASLYEKKLYQPVLNNI